MFCLLFQRLGTWGVIDCEIYLSSGRTLWLME